MKNITREHDYVVIGAGAGGLVVAVGLLKAGRDVVVISQNVGGDCTHFGCVPSKTLLHLAKVYAQSSTDTEKKLQTNALAQMRDVVSEFINEEQLLLPQDRFIKGSATFSSPNTIQVTTDAGLVEVRYKKKCVIATGSKPKRTRIEGVASEKLLTNEEFFYLKKLPESVTILGGGPIGAELATVCAQFGISTYLLSKSYLPKEHPDVAKRSLESLQQLGARYIPARPKVVHNNVLELDNGASIPETDVYITAVGREANTQLGLENALVKYDATGIMVSKNLVTSNPSIFAIGDCTQNPQFTHLAAEHGRFVLKKILLPFVQRRTPIIPRVTFTSPPVASVGEIIETGDTKLFELTLSQTDRARTQGDTHSYGMVAINTSTGKIIGATLFGESAEDLIQFFTLAITQGIPVLNFLNLITPYPTAANAVDKLANTYLTFILKNWKQKPFSSFIQLLKYLLG